jgi:hypothetical protein
VPEVSVSGDVQHGDLLLEDPGNGLLHGTWVLEVHVEVRSVAVLDRAEGAALASGGEVHGQPDGPG